MSQEYEGMDDRFLSSLNIIAGKYYLQDFSGADVRLIRSLGLSRENGCALGRIITGYAFTNYYKKKIGVSDAPECDAAFWSNI